MEASTIRLLFDIASIGIMVGVPFAVLVFPQYPFRLLTFRRRWMIAIMTGWALIIAHQLFYLKFNHTNPRPNDLSDFGELGVMAMGWILMVVGSLPSLVIYAVNDYRLKRGFSGLIKSFESTKK